MRAAIQFDRNVYSIRGVGGGIVLSAYTGDSINNAPVMQVLLPSDASEADQECAVEFLWDRLHERESVVSEYVPVPEKPRLTVVR